VDGNEQDWLPTQLCYYLLNKSKVISGERQSFVMGPRYKGIFLRMKRSRVPGSVHRFTESAQEQEERVCAASNYWSSTTFAGNTSFAWFVGFDNGGVADSVKIGKLFERAVRPCS